MFPRYLKGVDLSLGKLKHAGFIHGRFFEVAWEGSVKIASHILARAIQHIGYGYFVCLGGPERKRRQAANCDLLRAARIG